MVERIRLSDEPQGKWADMTDRRLQTEVGHVQSRPIPLDHLLITATSSGTAQTFYTVGAGKMLKVMQLAAVNSDTSPHTLTLHSIPAAGSIGTGNLELAELSIPSHTSADLTDFVGGLYVEGTVLKAYASAGSVVVLHGWGEEIQ